MDFRTLFEPQTMAIIGVSLSNDRHPANVIFSKNKLRYPVRIYPINPKGGLLQGEKVYASILDVPDKVDLAVIAVRAEQVAGVLADCIAAGVRGVIVISGGFAESGRTDLQAQLASMAAKAWLPMIGPNCLGIYSPGHVDTFFLPSERMVRPEAGAVAVVSQSGGILVDLLVKFAEEGIGLSRAISIGNKALVREKHLLDYLVGDPATKVITFYVEGFAENEGREFVQAAARSPKPVIVLKAGKTPGGSRAVSSHTASLAGDYAVFSAVLAQHGVVEARNEFELINFCGSLSCYQETIGNRIGIITSSGGHGALAVDTCSRHGLETPVFTEALQTTIRQRLSANVQGIAAVGNPIDLTGSAVEDDFVAATEVLCDVPDIDCIIVLLLPYLPGISSDLGARLSQVYRRERKPLIAYVPHIEKYKMLIEGFSLNRVPVSSSIDGAVLMADALRRCKAC
ncbi:MAG: CoA-binding protein [Deltaproteobacteria bacterium RIFOXYD12_FULL_57_12]|nr:MAG: CoA-binding protein [Deltaproteobacteria bacterium RIFOXYD12_FULL_57_12]